MKKLILIVMAISILVLSTACGNQVAAAPIATPKPAQDKDVEAFGAVKAASVKSITLDFQAPVTKVYVREGQHVKAGQQLVGLDLSDFRNQIRQKRISLTSAESSKKRVMVNTDMEKLENDQKNAQSIYYKDLKDLEAKQQLCDAGSVAQVEVDSIKKQLDADKKNLEDIAFSMESLKNSKSSENDLKSTDASLLQADLKLLDSRLSKPYMKGSDIVCDIDNGLVCDIGYVQGDLADPQKKLLSIMDLNSLVVEANVPEEFIADVKTGAAAQITPVADKSKKYTGKVSYISGIAVNNNGETQIPVRITLDKCDDFLLPGFNVDVSIAIR
jgi:multidrug resistance efflux pump